MNSKNKQIQKSQNQSESNIRTYDDNALKASILLCCDRLNISFECKNIINDIRACYPDLQTKYITEAIKQGSMGVYGRTYRFSFQEVSIWIREYKKNNRTNLNSGGVSMEELYNAGNND